MDQFFDQEFRQESEEWKNYGEGSMPINTYPEAVGKNVFKKALEKNQSLKKVKVPFRGRPQSNMDDEDEESDTSSQEDDPDLVTQFRQARAKTLLSSISTSPNADPPSDSGKGESKENEGQESKLDPVDATRKFNNVIIEEITAEVRADYENFKESIENDVKLTDPHKIIRIIENYPYLDLSLSVDDLKTQFEYNFNLLFEKAIKKKLISKENEVFIKNQFPSSIRRATLSAFLLKNVQLKEDSSYEEILTAFGTSSIPSLQSWCLAPENNERWQSIKNEWMNSKSQSEYKQLLYNLLFNASKGISKLERMILNNKSKLSIPVLSQCLEKLMYCPPNAIVDLSGFVEGALCEYNHQAEKNAARYQQIISDLMGELKTNVEMLRESDQTNRNWFVTNKKAIDDLTSQISKLKSSIEKINEDVDSITQKSLTLSTYSAKTQQSQLSSQSSEFYKMPEPKKTLVMKTPAPVQETKEQAKQYISLKWGPLEIVADYDTGDINYLECSNDQMTLDSDTKEFLETFANIKVLARFNGISYKNAWKIYDIAKGDINTMLEGAQVKLSKGKDPSENCLKKIKR